MKTVEWFRAAVVDRYRFSDMNFVRHCCFAAESVLADGSFGPLITVDFDKVPFSSEPMFLLTARLGAMLSGAPQPVLLKATHSCHQEALNESQAETAERDLPHGLPPKRPKTALASAHNDYYEPLVVDCC